MMSKKKSNKVKDKEYVFIYDVYGGFMDGEVVDRKVETLYLPNDLAAKKKAKEIDANYCNVIVVYEKGKNVKL